jgi:hypothetical protein
MPMSSFSRLRSAGVASSETVRNAYYAAVAVVLVVTAYLVGLSGK